MVIYHVVKIFYTDTLFEIRFGNIVEYLYENNKMVSPLSFILSGVNI